MNNRKWIFCFVLMVALSLTLAACMNNGGEVQPRVTRETSFMPEVTASNAPSDGMNPMADATQPPVAFDWVTGSGMIEGNINRISEVQDSRVVVTGSTALVGVKFTNAYQGEMTERIREMIAAEVKEADPSIQTVAVTALNDDVTKVYEISERLRSGEQAETLAEEINRIVRNATTLR